MTAFERAVRKTRQIAAGLNGILAFKLCSQRAVAHGRAAV